ncbi:MAG: hypothetical protein M3Y08_04965 [Fibrobacterota bacterium]|nr:hypothetical protein [Fibrobacterota bacterium]
MAGAEEEMFFFDGGAGVRLLGFLHRPFGLARDCGVVYCHPFAEERNQSQGCVVRAARSIAAKGIPVLRFDFSGCGDSEGVLEEASADAWIAEIGAAVDTLRRLTGVKRVGLWGLRSGANLAAHYGAARDDIAFGVYWQPVSDLKTSITQFLRQKLSSEMAAGSGEGFSVKGLVEKMETGGTVEVIGYSIRKTLYQSLASRTGPFAKMEFAHPVFLAAVTESETVPDAIARTAQGLKAPNAPVPLFHAKEAPFWDRYWRWESPILEAGTADWIGSVA